MERYLTCIGKICLLAVSHTLPAGSREVTDAFSFNLHVHVNPYAVGQEKGTSALYKDCDPLGYDAT
jgi:hypothetical protein